MSYQVEVILFIIVLLGCILSSPDEKVCPDCDGDGGVHSDNLFSDLCKKCEGTGTILKDDN